MHETVCLIRSLLPSKLLASSTSVSPGSPSSDMAVSASSNRPFEPIPPPPKFWRKRRSFMPRSNPSTAFLIGSESLVHIWFFSKAHARSMK